MDLVIRGSSSLVGHYAVLGLGLESGSCHPSTSTHNNDHWSPSSSPFSVDGVQPAGGETSPVEDKSSDFDKVAHFVFN